MNSFFNKLINKDKKKEPGVGELDDKNFEIDLQQLKRYNTEQLGEFIKKYEAYITNAKKKYRETYSDFKEQFEKNEKEKMKLITERDWFNAELHKTQKIVENEKKIKEELLIEINDFKNKGESSLLMNKMTNFLFNYSQQNLLDFQVILEFQQKFNEASALHQQLLQNFDQVKQSSIMQIEDFERILEEKIFQLQKIQFPVSEINQQINNTALSQSQSLQQKLDYEFLEQPQSSQGIFIRIYNVNDPAKNQDLLDFIQDETQESNNKINGNIQPKNQLYIEVQNMSEKIKQIQLVVSQVLETFNDEVQNFNSNYTQSHQILQNINNIINNQIINSVNNINEGIQNSLATFKENLRKDIESLAVEQNQNQNQSQEITQQIETLKTKLQKSQQTNGTLEKQYEDYKNELENKEILIINLQMELQNITNENLILQSKCNEAENKPENNETQDAIIESFKQQLEVKNNELIQLKKDYDELLQKEEQLKKNYSIIEEKATIRQNDIENRIIQERLKYDQKLKDFKRLEEQANENKQILIQQTEQNNENQKKIKELETQLIDVKNIAQDHKRKAKKQHQEYVNAQNKYWSDMAEKDQVIESLQEKLKDFETNKEQEKTSIFSKDVEIHNLRLQISTLQDEIENFVKQIENLESEKNRLIKQNKDKNDFIQQLKEKREFAIQEIKRLTSSSYSNSSVTSKGEKEFEHGALEKSIKPTSLSSGGISESSKDPNLKKWVLQILQYIKKELEKLYKEFLPLLPQNMESADAEKYFFIEKKLNDIKSKALEYFEYVQDLKV